MVDALPDPDRPFCPSCRRDRYQHELEDGRCKHCDSEVTDAWPVWARLLRALVKGTVSRAKVLIIVGPPGWVVWNFAAAVWSGAPLLASETVTVSREVTRWNGAVPAALDALPAAVVGLWLLAITFAVTRGALPRRI